MMKTGIAFMLSAFLLVCNLAHADLWPMQIGDRMIFNRTDSAGASWTFEIEVLEEATIHGKQYYRVREANYNIGEVDYFYWRSTENEIYASDGINEFVLFQIVPVGTKWTFGDREVEMMPNETVSVPYGGPYNAYVIRSRKPAVGSPYWYNYFVPGLGHVKEVDYYTDNAPKIVELIDKYRIYTQAELNAAVQDERKKWDVNGDDKKGLEEAVDALRVVSGIYSEPED